MNGGRRPNYTGTYYKDAKGRYVGEVRYTINNEKKRKRFSRKSERKVKKLTQEFGKQIKIKLDELRNNTDTEPEPNPLQNDPYVVDEMYTWLEVKQEELKMTSFSSLYKIATKEVIPSLEDVKLSEFDVKHVEKIINRMAERGLSMSMIKKTVSCLRGFYTYEIQQHKLYEKGITNFVPLAKIPTQKIKPAKKIIPLSDTECQKFIAVASIKNSVYSPVCLLLIQTGLRASEALAIKRSDIDFENNTLYVHRNLVYDNEISNIKGKVQKKRVPRIQETTKSAAGERVIPLNEAAIRILSNLKPNKDGFMFYGENGNFLDDSNLRRFAKKCLNEIGAGDRGSILHLLRHSYATALFRAGIPTVMISELLGHSGTQITEKTYVHAIQSIKFSKNTDYKFNPYPEYLR